MLRSDLIQSGAHAIASDRAEEIDDQHFEDSEAALDAFVAAVDSHLAHRLTPEFEGDERVGVFRLLATLRGSS